MSNLDKVMYPLIGFTKAQVIDYYVRIAPVMLAHVGDRGITLRRWPDGVTGESFFEKRCPKHRPGWVGTCAGPGDRGGLIDYCRLDSVAALAWSANLAALEIHAPMARCADIDSPTMAVFDLDPGAPATIIECCRVALHIREVLDAVGLAAWAKTSGSKGLQLYVPLKPAPHPRPRGRLRPGRGPAAGAADARPCGVGHEAKPSSQQGLHRLGSERPLQDHRRPVLAAGGGIAPRRRPPSPGTRCPDGADGEPLTFTAADVLERLDEFGDLFAPTLTVEQDLPSPSPPG